MKLKAISLSLLAMCAASEAATIYDADETSLAAGGRVQSVFYNSSASKLNELNQSNSSTLVNSARFSLEGTSKINGHLKAFAFAEWDMADGNQNREKIKAREQYVGLDFGSYGKVLAGRTYSAMKSVIETTDIFEDFGCTGQFGEDDFRSGTIRYIYEDNGFFASLSYNLASDDQAVEGVEYDEFDSEGKVNIKSGFAAALGYTTKDFLLGPLSVKAGYEYLRVQNHDGTYPSSDSLETGMFGNSIYSPAVRNIKGIAASVKWGGDEGFSVAALYNTRKITLTSGFIKSVNEAADEDVAFSYRLNGYELALAYGFDCGVSIASGYAFTQIKGDHQGNSEISRRIPVYINYELNENFNIWTEAQFNAGDEHKSKELTKSLFSAGARYTF